MCIAIVTKPGASVSEDRLSNCFDNNGDGAGLAYIHKDEKKVRIEKGFFNKEGFIRRYNALLREGHMLDNAALLHFRIHTMGSVKTDNCHPFKIKNGAMIHNGSFFYASPYIAKDKSDTRIIADMLGEQITYDRVARQKEVINDIIGYNRVAMLFDSGQYIILNEEEGVWDDKVWYSNVSYLGTRDSWLDRGRNRSIIGDY